MESALSRLNREVDEIERRSEERAALMAIAALAKKHAPHGVPEHAACFFKDGDAWCCVRGDFVNLQESPAGFGATMDAALNALARQPLGRTG